MTTEAQHVEGVHQGKRHTARRKRLCAFGGCQQVFQPGIEPIMNLCSGCSSAKPDASLASDWRELQEWS